MSNTLTLPASMQPPAPPSNALDTTPGANPTEPVVHYQLSSGHVATLPQSSVPALLKQDAGAKQIPSPADGEVLVQLSSGHTATLPTSSLDALKQQDPGYTYIAGNTTSPKTMSPAPDALSAVAGPTTALGAATPQPVRDEMSGVADMARGNFVRGVKRVWETEKPHVIQGSPLEQTIQRIDPTFQGSATPTQATAGSARPTSQPFVDAAQYVDKSKHPILKAVAETAQSATSPEAVATLISTGGLGLVESPQALSMASSLINAGFSAAAIANAYKSGLAGFKEAYTNGDTVEAKYLLTHALLSGTLAAISAKAATDSFRPVNPWAAAREAANAAKQVISPRVAGEDFVAYPMRSNANQAAGTQAVKNVASDTSAASGGLPVSHASSLRDVFQEPIAAQEAASQTFYKALDDASNNQWTANQNALKNVRKEIQMKSGLDEATDAKLNAAKTRLEWQQERIIDSAVNNPTNPMPEDVAQQARRTWQAKSRLEDIQDIFDKKSNVSGIRPEMVKSGVHGLPAEQYNFKGIAKDLNAMSPDDLNLALGKEGAQNLVTSVNLAAKQGWGTSKFIGAIKGILLAKGGLGVVSHLVP